MTVYFEEVKFETDEEIQILDITLMIRNVIKASKIDNGIVNVFVPGATGAITAMEFEPRLIEDTKTMIEKLIPKGIGYKHDFQDDNAHSHLRASIFKPELTVPVRNMEPILGTWQQIVFMEFDTRGRERKLIVTVIGE